MGKTTFGIRVHPGYTVPVWCGIAEIGPGDESARDQYRIVYLEEGAGSVSINGSMEPCIAPAAVCLNEHDTFSAASPPARLVYFHPSYVNSVFTLENVRDDARFSGTDYRDRHYFRPFFLRENGYRGIIAMSDMNGIEFKRLFDRLSHELNGQPDGFWPCRARSYLIEILFLLFRLQLSRDTVPPSPESALQDCGSSGSFAVRVISWMYAHYREKLTMEDLTKEFALNRTSLNARFMEETHVPVMTYLLKLRVRLAAFILRDTMIPVSEVCDRSGFQDLSNFNRMFKKHTGLSPTGYRRKFNRLVS